MGGLTNHPPEIISGGFRQLGDCSQVPISRVQNHCSHIILRQLCHNFLIILGGGGGTLDAGERSQSHPPLYETLYINIIIIIIYGAAKILLRLLCIMYLLSAVCHFKYKMFILHPTNI